MCFSEIWVELNRQSDLASCFGEFTGAQIKSSQRKVSLPGVIFNSQALTQRLLGFCILVLSPVEFAQLEVRISSPGFNLQGAPEGLLRFSQLLSVHVRQA